MKILVTVGTTAFDELVAFIDKNSFFNAHDVTIQYGPGKVIPKNRSAFSFVNHIEKYYRSSDFVITHGGAGSIYKLLELSLPLCAVPNLERCDDHQLDICKHLSSRKHILFSEDVNGIPRCVQQFIDRKVELIPFGKVAFFCAGEISDFLLSR